MFMERETVDSDLRQRNLFLCVIVTLNHPINQIVSKTSWISLSGLERQFPNTRHLSHCQKRLNENLAFIKGKYPLRLSNNFVVSLIVFFIISMF
jgi:hypothetical protein